MNRNPAQGFYESSVRFPGNLALSIGESQYTYSELRGIVQRVAAWLRRNSQVEAPRVGILAARSLSTFAGILGTCWAGGTYVPISPKLPEERLLQLLDCIRAEALIVDRDTVRLLTPRVLAHCPRLILAPELTSSPTTKTNGAPAPDISTQDALPDFDPHDSPVSVSADSTSYIIFTSGTTGVPKGVMITASAVAQFVSVMQQRYAVQPADRVAGMTEITFDISVFDLFVTWAAGAALIVVPATQLMAPAGFVHRQRCSIFFSVPSVIAGMQRMKMLAPNSLPTLRYSFFAGEPLPVNSAAHWQQAAPNSIVDNLYGPTEATIVCIGQRFHGPQNATPQRGVVAIGTPFEGMQAAIIDSSSRFLPYGEHGELLLAGPQLSAGYFGAEDLTRAAFPVIEGTRWYRTGDLAYRDTPGIFHHLGRIDNQVKVRGLRVELEEVEAYLRDIFRTDSVAAVAWPVEHGSASGIVAFVSSQLGVDDPELLSQIKSRLPSYMVPSTIHRIEALPLNANGKVNRHQLVSLLQEGRL